MSAAENKLIRIHRIEKVVPVLFWLILAVGLFLRFYQYLLGRSLWEDETHLALNFIKYNYFDLLKPLDHIQGAPVLFLFITEFIVNLFGTGELAFRAFPFIASILTLPLFYYLVLDPTKSRLTALTGFLILSCNLALIYFASELKPYGVDVSFHILLVFLSVSNSQWVDQKRYLLLGLTGCVAILVSLSAFIILFCIACTIFYRWYIQRHVHKKDIFVLLSWAIVFAGNYFLFIHDHPHTDDQRLNYASAFVPVNPLSPEFRDFFSRTINDIAFSSLLYASPDYGFPYVLIALIIIGIITVVLKKNVVLLIFTCVPVLTHLTLSALHFYPFVYRLILYLVPSFVLLVTIGIVAIADLFAKKSMVLAAFLVIYCVICMVIESFKRFPVWSREIKPSLDFINTTMPAANVYAFDPVNAYTYYYHRGYVKKPVLKELQWEMDPAEFYKLLAYEKRNYALIYGMNFRWGYGDVIEDLKKNNLIVKTFEYKNYSVSEVRPKMSDTLTTKLIIDYSYFDPAVTFGENYVVAIWGGEVKSIPVEVKKGNYLMEVSANGTPVENVYPVLEFFVNDVSFGQVVTEAATKKFLFPLEISGDTAIIFKLKMLNDAAKDKEDRNAFVPQIELIRAE